MYLLAPILLKPSSKTFSDDTQTSKFTKTIQSLCEPRDIERKVLFPHSARS